MKTDKSVEAFIALVKAGLWEKDVRFSMLDAIDYNRVYQLAEVQTVVGLVAAGLEHISGLHVPKEIVLQFVGQSLQLEQRCKAMNIFIGGIVDKMRQSDIYALLVKGQGLAQCYERPLWRTAGDIDFLLSGENYHKAIECLLPISSDSKIGGYYSKEFALTINPWIIELHGSMRTGLSSRIDREIDDVQHDVFFGGNVRSWNNSGTTVFIPSPNNDVFLVFTHYIKHFYKERMILRQICDWCRLLWTFKDSLNHELLEKRLYRAGLMNEWKAFAALSVVYLGMPSEAMPLYSDEERWGQKAKKILAHILRGGEYRKVHDTVAVGKIFPISVLKFAPGILFNVNYMKIKEKIFN